MSLVYFVDPNAETLEVEVTKSLDGFLEGLFIDNEGHFEEVAFERGADGSWYELNDSQTPWTLVVPEERK